jgi:hypothetical protein
MRARDWLSSEGGAAGGPFAEGVALGDLEPSMRLIVLTSNSRYEIVVLDARRVQIQGGRRFPKPRVTILAGCGSDGTAFKVGWLGVGCRMILQIDDRPVVTSRIRAIIVHGQDDSAGQPVTAA